MKVFPCNTKPEQAQVATFTADELVDEGIYQPTKGRTACYVVVIKAWGSTARLYVSGERERVVEPFCERVWNDYRFVKVPNALLCLEIKTGEKA